MTEFNTSNSYSSIEEEVKHLREAHRLLTRLWCGTNASDCVRYDLSKEINDYLGTDY